MKNEFPYQDPMLPVEQRVADLVSRMTLKEKVSQMIFDSPAIERLGIPKYNWWNECLHGVLGSGAVTVFPQSIGLAATWNTTLMHRVATAISDEARAKYHKAIEQGIREIFRGLTFWSPNVNLFRDPRWGRGQETYGECPYLTSRMGVAFVKGVQGDDPRYLKAISTPKHYAVHSGPESLRHSFDAQVDERDLRQSYLPHFEACVKEGGARSVMGAYNRTNGEPCCASPKLLDQILRREWGFGGPSGNEGYVVSDCWAIADIYRKHKVVETAEKAAVLAVSNGCDLNCGETYPALLEAVKQGLIDEAAINRSVIRLFNARFRLGMFDPPEMVAYARIPHSVVDSPEHRQLALLAAKESIVLLKNEDNLLPLDKDIKSIAIIGPNADELAPLLGNYNGMPSTAITLPEGIRRKVSPRTRVYCATGCELAAGLPHLTPIPHTCLRPADNDAGVSGLKGDYYTDSKLTGEPVLTRIDPVVDFKWWKESDPFAGTNPSAVRWSGFLAPHVTGTYQIGFDAREKSRLFLDGRVICEKMEYNQCINFTEVELEAGRLYPVQLESPVGKYSFAQLLWSAPGIDLLAQALEIAGKAEVVVMALGLSPVVEGEEILIKLEEFNGGDRTEIALPRPQRELLQRIHSLGKTIVLVLFGGSAIAIPWANDHIPAILAAWYPGEEGGSALADIIFGDYNPAGRLPVTF